MKSKNWFSETKSTKKISKKQWITSRARTLAARVALVAAAVAGITTTTTTTVKVGMMTRI